MTEYIKSAKPGSNPNFCLTSGAVCFGGYCPSCAQWVIVCIWFQGKYEFESPLSGCCPICRRDVAVRGFYAHRCGGKMSFLNGDSLVFKRSFHPLGAGIPYRFFFDFIFDELKLILENLFFHFYSYIATPEEKWTTMLLQISTPKDTPEFRAKRTPCKKENCECELQMSEIKDVWEGNFNPHTAKCFSCDHRVVYHQD